MKKFLFSFNLMVSLSILLSSFWFGGLVTSQPVVPLVTIRFANPEWHATTSQYCVDAEFLSDTSDIQVFGVNVRFFYDDSILEFTGFDDFQSGYAAVAPNPPHVNTSEAGPSLFGFEGPADFVNGAIQLVSTDTPLVLDTVQWTKLFRVCFDIDDPDPNVESFCPSLVWDMEANPANGGFLVGDDGVVITVVDPDPAYDSAPAYENVVQFNWRYVGSGGIPWGEPIEEVCIPLGLPLTMSAPLNLSLDCSASTDPSVTGFATATDNCEGEIVITYSDESALGACRFNIVITRTWTATNNCGETVSVNQMIQVADTTVPVITAPLDVTISCIADSSPIVTGMASAIDNCDPEPMVFVAGDSILEQTCTNQLEIIRSFVAIDACGNTSSSTQRITVQDTLDPEFSIPENSILSLLNSDGPTLIYLSDTAIMHQLNTFNESSIEGSDNCNDQITPMFSVTSTIADNCVEAGYAERRLFTWLLTDVCGNTTEVQYIVDIMDDVAPVIIGVPDDQQIFCEQLPPVPFVYSDDPAQPVNIIFAETIAEGGQQGTFDVYRHWRAFDACGNATMKIQHILWRPESLLECTIDIPKKEICNSNVIVKSNIIGNTEGVTYLWELIGVGSYIRSGQATPRILVHVGDSPVKVILTLTDEFGCKVVCSASIDCIHSSPSFIRNRSSMDASDSLFTRILLDELPVYEQQNIDIEAIRVWPNPTKGQVSMSIDAQKEGMLVVGIYNLLGQEMKQEQVNCQPGLNTWLMDLSDMKDGSYVVRMTKDAGVLTTIVVLLR